MGRTTPRPPSELPLILDDADKAVLAEVGSTLLGHQAEILAAWRSFFSELAPLPPEKAREMESRFESAISQFFSSIQARDYARFTQEARSLGLELAELDVPFTVIPFTIQYLSRSYMPFLNRYYTGSDLKHRIQLLNLLMQHYSTALASGYFQRREEDLNTALTNLREIDRLKEDFLSILNHELRTPLSFIVAYASTLQEQLLGELEDPQKQAVSAIMEGANRLTRLVDHLMEAGQAVSGQLSVAIEPVDLVPIAQSAIEQARRRCAKPGIVLWIGIPEKLPMVSADPLRYAEVLRHLLDNACKFTERGEIRLRLDLQDQRVCTEIGDTGIGMSPEDLRRVFTTFFQAEPARTHHKAGTGLGLFIVKSLVDEMEGTISLESEKGKGTTVRLCLPALPSRGAHAEGD